MLWVFLALMATFVWAWVNMIDKVLVTKFLKSPIALSASFGIFSFPLGLILLSFIGIPSVPTVYFVAAVLSGSFILYGVIFYLKSLSVEETSRVVPLWHLSPIFVLILAVIFLDEILLPLKYVAFASILLGGFLISTRRIKKVFRISPALRYMLLSSILVAIADVLLKFAHTIDMFWQVFLVFYFGVSLSSLSLFFLKNARMDFFRTYTASRNRFMPLLFLSMFLGSLGILSWNGAVLLGPITLISVFVGFQSLFVLLIATFLSKKFPLFIKEAIDAKTIGIKLAAIALMIFGLILLAI